MTKVRNKATVEFSSTVTLSESAIRALDALVGYGDDAFLKAFKENLGEAYIRKHEGGLKEFFAIVREQVLPPLADIDQARRDIHDAIKKREEDRQERLREANKSK